MNIECRGTVFYLFYILKKAERSLRLVGLFAPTPRRATSTIRQSSFHEVSYEGVEIGFNPQIEGISLSHFM